MASKFLKKMGFLFFVVALSSGAGAFMSGCSYFGFGGEEEEIDSLDKEFEASKGAGEEAGGKEGGATDIQSELSGLSAKQAESQDKIRDLEDNIKSLEMELRDLQDAKKDVEEKLANVKQGGGSGEDVGALREKLASLQEEIQDMKSRTSDRKVERGVARSRTSSGEGVGVKKGYDRALQLYNARKYSEALNALDELSQMSPPDDLADNIAFWTGQCFYKLADYDKAIDRFHDVIDNYPRSNKIHDTRYMLGLSYNATGEKSKAIEVLQNALDERPPAAIRDKIKTAIRNIE